MTDQALFAGANFLVSILLARWLKPAAYGAFSLAYAIFLLLGTVHTGLWTEPMLVYGSGRYRENFPAYQQILLRHHSFATGTPVLAANIGAVGEITDNGRTGLHFHPGDPSDLAAKVDWLLSHPKELAQMRKEARREYEAKYTAQRNYEMLMESYAQAIANHRKR